MILEFRSGAADENKSKGFNIFDEAAKSMSFSEQEIEEFKAEAMDLLDVAEKSLLSLDQGAEFKPAYDAVFRGFHNLKGAAGMMELTKLAEHTHELESTLIKFKNAAGMPKSYVSMFLRGIDAARSLLNNQDVNFDFAIIEDREPSKAKPSAAQTSGSARAEVSKEALDEFFSESEEIVERVSKTLHKVEASASDKGDIDSLYRDIHSLKGSAYLFSFKKLGDVAHIMESALEPVREGSQQTTKQLLDGLFKGLQLMEALVNLAKSELSDDDFAGIVESYARTMGTELKAATPAEAAVRESIALPTAPVAQAAAAAHAEGEAGGSIRVPVALLDNLMTLMGEMVLVRNQVLQFSNKSNDLEFLSMSKRLNLVTSEMQGEMMKTRMQPIGNVLSKFNRVVRDLSQELKKNIQLSLAGVETELDKSLLEAIKDPLTHIVRNSCDHGVEGPADRKRAGKSEAGHISIKSYHEGGQVIVDIADDGKGLHKDVILKKAMERGLVTTAQGAKMSEKEIFNLIFAPGFSTAAAITNVSGRGVGMDVVRTNIEKIGGTVDLSSEAGAGTTIKLRIPLTLAIVPALMVKSGEGTYAIPQVKLEELVRIESGADGQSLEMLHGAPVYRLRGNILPLVDLNSVLGMAAPRNYKNGAFNVAVVNTGQIVFGLIVDEVKDTADIVVKPLNRLLKSLRVYSGATILGDGSVALILDVAGVAKVANLTQHKERVQDAQEASAQNKKVAEAQDYLLVQLNSPTKHAIVLGFVHRLEEVKRSQVEYSGAQPVVRYRESILPLVSVSELLGYGRRAQGKSEEVMSVVVIRRAGVLYGLEVDAILDTLTSSAELVSMHTKQQGLFGSIDIGEELVVVLDPFEVIAKAFPGAHPEPKVAAPSMAPPLALAERNYHRGRVLLAEDTLFFRKAIKKVLEGYGFEVITASDGQDAIEILNRADQPFDLLVSDIEMPRVNGFQLAAQIRKNPKYATLPLLALSSRADKEYLQEGQRVGFDIYLEKLKPNTLLAAINKLMEKRQGVA